jgi:CspA family cold shock protein
MRAVDFRPIDPKARATSTLAAFADVYLQNLDTTGPQGPKRSKQDRNTGMATGTVKWFNSQKGFGFIQPDAGGPDVFVHISAVERSGMNGLAEGQKVNFEVAQDRRTGKSAAQNLSAAG